MSAVPSEPLDCEQIEETCAATLDDWAVDGRRVLVLIPDGTRTCPLPALFRAVHGRLGGRVAALDFLVALGTHQPMTDEAIRRLVGIDTEAEQQELGNVRFLNHRWNDPGALMEIGRLDKREVQELSGGCLSLEVPILINRAVADYDHLLILGPVFPHEVAGFSGGNKYLFPGISGPQIIDFFHWLGAMVTNRSIIGRTHTPVRAVLDRAAGMVDIDRRALCMVVRPDGELAGLYGGEPESAWSRAADLSAQLHVRYFERPFHTVLSCAPPMYPDLWTGGKCMYKIEPVVADGGELVVYAPHIADVSVVHGAVIERVGYHVRDYFLAQWDRFRNEPWGVLAHSTHVKGDGSYQGGIERPRIEVVLATGIDEATCRRIGLGYRDPATIDPREYADLEESGVLLVSRAGETLYRLR